MRTGGETSAPECGFALDWLDIDEDQHAETMAGAPDDIRDRIDSADYFFPDAAAAWRYRWPDEIRDEILARVLALNAHHAELEPLTGLPSSGSADTRGDSAAPTASDADTDTPTTPKPKRTKKAIKRASKKSAPRPMFDE